MKKKSLYDIAMEKKKNQNEENDNIYKKKVNNINNNRNYKQTIKIDDVYSISHFINNRGNSNF